MKLKMFFMVSMSFALFFVLTQLHALNPKLELLSLSKMTQGQKEYNSLRTKLDNAVKLINEKGEDAFETIKKDNEKSDGTEGIFVIEPATGKLLVSPSAESIGKEALNNSEINGKAIAREAILKAYTELYGSNWDIWASSMGDVYNSYITQIAITMDGKVYAVAIGKNDKELQRFFVTTIVDKACETINQVGMEKAFEIFSKENSIYRFKDTYIYVYELKSADNVVCLYNPNYPEDIGKNLINMKVGSGYVIKDIYNLLEEARSGWVRSEAISPQTKEVLAKDIYVKSTTVNGVRLAVGSGVYLAK